MLTYRRQIPSNLNNFIRISQFEIVWQSLLDHHFQSETQYICTNTENTLSYMYDMVWLHSENHIVYCEDKTDKEIDIAVSCK